MSEPTFHWPLKVGLVALIAAGVAMAVTALVAAVIHGQISQAWAFLVVAAVLTAAAIAVLRGVRWVIAMSFVALAGQILAVFGTVVELTSGVAGFKQHQLHSLGFDPTVAVTFNLIYSTAGFGLFCWLAWRWQKRPDRDSGTSK